MLKFVIALTSASIFILSGCAEVPAQSAAEPAPPITSTPAPKAEAKPSLSSEAKAALVQAEADVKEAKAKNALWTTAQDALKRARDAAEEFDNDAVIKNAKEASEHAKLGIAQTKYPSTYR